MTYQTYKNMGLSAADCKAYGRNLIVFENEESAVYFSELIGPSNVNEVTDGFLVNVLGCFADTYGWSDMLLAAKKSNAKLAYRII